jgi:hypothetical protein
MLKRFEAQAFEAFRQELGLTPFCARNVSRLPNDPSARRLTRNYGASSALRRTLEQVRDGGRANRTTIFGTTLLRSPSWAEGLGARLHVVPHRR